MKRAVRYKQEAERYAQLADTATGMFHDAYLVLEASYRALAVSVTQELWWPSRPPPSEDEEPGS
jgi:hypothetical protein